MIIHSNLFKMKNKILPICLQGNWRLRQFRRVQQYIIVIHIIYGIFGAGRVEQTLLEKYSISRPFSDIATNFKMGSQNL